MSAPSTVSPEKILKELRGLWSDLGKQEKSGVLRACSMTLISVLDESHDPMALGESIASLMHEHPSRSIMLRIRHSSGLHLESRVFAQCWMPFGRRQQICCEQIELTASAQSLADVPGVVRGLITPDLPVVLFCPGAEVCQSPEFQVLLPLAGKLIVDSASSGDSGGLLRWMHQLTRARPHRADLVWARLTPWRESIAQIFDDPAQRKAVYALTDIDLQYAGETEPVSVHYLAGWFMHILGAGVHLNVARSAGPAFNGIVRVALRGPHLNASLEMIEENIVSVQVDGSEQRTVFPSLSEVDALRRELSILGRDPVFEDVIGLANVLRGNP